MTDWEAKRYWGPTVFVQGIKRMQDVNIKQVKFVFVIELGMKKQQKKLKFQQIFAFQFTTYMNFYILVVNTTNTFLCLTIKISTFDTYVYVKFLRPFCVKTVLYSLFPIYTIYFSVACCCFANMCLKCNVKIKHFWEWWTFGKSVKKKLWSQNKLNYGLICGCSSKCKRKSCSSA
jgi:hypothetical protein